MFGQQNGAAGQLHARAAAPPAPIADTVVDIAVRIELARPVSGHRGAIGEVALKVPTFGDYIDCGPVQRNIAIDPTASAGAMKIEVVDDSAAMMRWMVRLSGLPEAVLRTLGPRDAFAVRREILAMVREFEQGNSPDAPTSSSSPAA